MKNAEGFRNLTKLTSTAFLEGFYYRPRVDKETPPSSPGWPHLLSACLQGSIPWRLRRGDRVGAKRAAWITATWPVGELLPGDHGERPSGNVGGVNGELISPWGGNTTSPRGHQTLPIILRREGRGGPTRSACASRREKTSSRTPAGMALPDGTSSTSSPHGVMEEQFQYLPPWRWGKRRPHRRTVQFLLQVRRELPPPLLNSTRVIHRPSLSRPGSPGRASKGIHSTPRRERGRKSGRSMKSVSSRSW